MLAPPQGAGLLSHSPGTAEGSPRERRRQSFQNVTPSHAQTGSRVSSQKVGLFRHTPMASLHWKRSQYDDTLQSSLLAHG